ncbi:hypothetical protein [Acidovorax sp. NB1]|uniref:hypothetical protein n=1 Tax=Acidovorax sp. NB1 TaxID=1943571 RepID=UPI0010F18692|nr:hypothetical protein [Acidovorax sp. NB1]GDY37245.1 hypothetical protein ACINB_31370 [Acidovorax sp. NB1]
MAEHLTDPNKAVDYLIEHSRKYAQAKADRVHLEHFRKSKKALLMNECTDKAVTAREQYAYSHPDYIALLEGLREAVRVEETLRWRLTAAQLRVEVWRSENANNRRQEGATR